MFQNSYFHEQPLHSLFPEAVPFWDAEKERSDSENYKYFSFVLCVLGKSDTTSHSRGQNLTTPSQNYPNRKLPSELGSWKIVTLLPHKISKNFIHLPEMPIQMSKKQTMQIYTGLSFLYTLGSQSFISFGAGKKIIKMFNIEAQIDKPMKT